MAEEQRACAVRWAAKAGSRQQTGLQTALEAEEATAAAIVWPSVRVHCPYI
jgi:hypothetical protein